MLNKKKLKFNNKKFFTEQSLLSANELNFTGCWVNVSTNQNPHAEKQKHKYFSISKYFYYWIKTNKFEKKVWRLFLVISNLNL